MNEVTLGLAILLAVGILAAKLAQIIHLPSVTGYILAGLALGPSGLGLITSEDIGLRLHHFSQIALMLIAFGIGEHIELRKIGGISRQVISIALGQALAAFALVGLVVYWIIGLDQPGSNPADAPILAILLGAVAMTTSPAAVLHVVRETRSRGPITSTLMAVVAAGDGLAIVAFGMALSVARQLAGDGAAGPSDAILAVCAEVFISIPAGILTGLLIDYALHKLHTRGEMLSGGLALLLLCGETMRHFHFSPLLAGMAAGFIIINRAERDERLFRVLNAFEPPIYVLFFTLAGAHLDLTSLGSAGWLGLIYFAARLTGKYCGAWFGALFSRATPLVRNSLGLALIPQAGISIGLIFLVNSDPILARYSASVTQVVLSGVVLAELFGPLFVRLTLNKAGENKSAKKREECKNLSNAACSTWLRGPDGNTIPPWTHGELHPAATTEGVVAFGAHHEATVRGLARIATILAHHFHALPMSIRVVAKEDKGKLSDAATESMLLPERNEIKALGYPMLAEVVHDTPASGLVSATEYSEAKALVVGYPLNSSPGAIEQVIERVAANVTCPVVIARFAGHFQIDRVLVPFVDEEELDDLHFLIDALLAVSPPRITLLQLLRFDSSLEEIETARQWLGAWRAMHLLDTQSRQMIEASESRLETILGASLGEDLIIMTAGHRRRLQRLFFGSLANAVAQNCDRPLLIVYTPEKKKTESKENGDKEA